MAKSSLFNRLLPALFCSVLLVNVGSAQTIPVVNIAQLQDSIAQAKGITIINFWSTWCKPCIDEVPEFLKVARQFETQNVHLKLVSLDTKKLYQSGDLAKWLAKKNWDVQVWWLNETNADVYCPAVDAAWGGVIPATLIIRPETGYRLFVEESMNEQELRAQIVKALTSSKQ